MNSGRTHLLLVHHRHMDQFASIYKSINRNPYHFGAETEPAKEISRFSSKNITRVPR